jgi:hypothetical protein
MALIKKGKYWYGTDANTSVDDIKTEMRRYSLQNSYEAMQFASSVCQCGSTHFKLETDEDEGAARRICVGCDAVVLMGDSAEYAADANFDNHECICDGVTFELLSGVALYANSNDVKWYYIGCKCATCSLVGVFADWKCEAGDAKAFLQKI